ncbi:helix-turn-helix domain-containing protein [Sciscionella marina]|uniref:helix-turn-helix domain-containing protein n=1 Tax=Sciscionella marina TaxID=508770 RepID=UPI003B82E220
MNLLTVEQVAAFLCVADKTVYQNWRTWGLKGVRIGGGSNGPIRFRPKDVERLASSWEE